MARKPMKPCNYPNCPNVTVKDYCEEHSNYRQSKKSSLYNYQWRKARERFLVLHPFCECDECKRGKPQLATVVDHKIPHKGDKKLFWDQTNWQAMSEPHHNRKTARQDMGSWGIK